MAEETVILKIEVDNTQAIQNIEAYNAAIDESKKAQDELKKSIEATDATTEEGAKTKADLVRALETEKQKTTDLTTAKKANIKVLAAEKNSIDALEKSIAAEVKKRKMLTDITGENKEEYEKLTKSIAANQAKLNEYNKAIGRTHGNVGNYKEAIKAAVGEMGLFSQANAATGGALGILRTGIGGVTKGLTGMKAALMATGIGALFVVLGTAIGAVVGYFKRFDEGQEAIERFSAGASAALDVVIKRVMAFLGGVGSILSGEFVKGWQELKTAVSGFGAEVSSTFGAVSDLTGGLQKLEDKERELSGMRTKMNLDLAKAREILASDSEYSAEVQLKALREVTEAEGNLLDYEVKLAQERAGLLKKKMENDASSNDEYKKEYQDALNRVYELQTESIQRTIKLKKQEAGLLAEAEKEKADAAKKAADEAYMRQKVEAIQGIGAATSLKDTQIKLAQETTAALNDELTKRGQDLEEHLQWSAKLAAKAAAEALAKSREMAGALSGFAATVGSIIGDTFTDTKKGLNDFLRDSFKALVQTIDNAATAAITKIIFAQFEAGATLNPVKLAAATASLVGVKAASAGFQNLLSVPQLARGGVFEGASHAGGGVPLYAGGRQIAEVEGGEAFFVLNKKATREIEALSAINKQYGGIDLGTKTTHAAAGGNIAVPNQIEAIDYTKLAAAMAATNIVVRVTDINNGQQNRARAVSAGVV